MFPPTECPSGWVKILERCVYNSYDINEIESKWMDARLNCELMHPNTTLISVRSENELSIMKGKCIRNIKPPSSKTFSTYRTSKF